PRHAGPAKRSCGPVHTTCYIQGNRTIFGLQIYYKLLHAIMLATVMGFTNGQQTTCNCTQSWTYEIVWLTTPRRNKNTQIANRAHTSDSFLSHERENP